MDYKEELKNLKVEDKKKEKTRKGTFDKKFIIEILIMAFIVSFLMSFISEITIPKVNVFFGIIITLLFIFIGIFFDIIGISVTASDEKIFHSMNSRKVKGADVAVKFKQNAEKVSSFCCDVIGDVCGVVSGSAAVIIAASLYSVVPISHFLISLIVTAIVASITITGKAMGKTYAIKKGDIIFFKFSRVVSHVYKVK